MGTGKIQVFCLELLVDIEEHADEWKARWITLDSQLLKQAAKGVFLVLVGTQQGRLHALANAAKTIIWC